MIIDYNKINELNKIEYIKALILNFEGQKKYNLIFITFNIAVIVFLMDRVALKADLPNNILDYKLYFLFVIVLYFLSAGLFTIWLALIHRFSIEAIDLLITLDIEKARNENYPNWGNFKKWGWIDLLAIFFMISGVVLTIILFLLCNGLL